MRRAPSQFESLVVVLASLVSLAFLAACDKKPQDCRALIGIIDDDDHKIAEIGAAAKGVEQAARLSELAKQLAALEDKLASDLAALTVTTPGVKTLSGAYQDFAKEAAASARDSAQVMDSVVAYEPKVDAANPEGVPQRTKSAVDKMTDRCKTHKSTECVRLYDGMKKIMPDTTKTASYAEQAKQVDAFAVQESANKFKDAELQKAFDEFLASMKSIAAVLHEAADLRVKMDAAKAKLDGVLAKEKPLTDGVNAFCVPQHLSSAPDAATVF